MEEASQDLYLDYLRFFDIFQKILSLVWNNEWYLRWWGSPWARKIRPKIIEEYSNRSW
jgi:hypothetical protein